ncbi:HD domain-containing protein [Thalassovita aquimarina]|uniref:HD domain-containing protein n=1 Tax=Thalassovita aquimarina TaxID=2785917 RepID=A0ABS5HMU3_9RHOB|nr:HD domain-containing protein [Thalassovita aquimarina]MBR9650281.1 HD domain-containing protein [Thalassovita aquimarina]
METLRRTLRNIAERDMAQDSAHDLAHLDRVWTTSQRIAETEGGDLRVLIAAAYLHDLVNLPKDAPDRAQASRLAAQAAAPHLRALGFSAPEIENTRHAIEAHSFSAGIEPETVEARILCDADRMDAIGAIGIARAFSVSGQLDRPIYDPDDPFAAERDPDDSAFSLDHWPVKLLRLAEGMQTATGRALARDRVAVMHRFLTDLAGEIGTEPPQHWNTASC